MRKKLLIFILLVFSVFIPSFIKTGFALDDYKDIESYTLAEHKVGWKNLGINQGIEGEKISLKWKGEQRFFKKGYVAHANSKLLFVLNDTHNTNIYDEFRCYLGVLYQKGDKGDGVKFQIKVGTKIAGADGTKETDFTWETTYNSNKVFKGNTESEYVKINVKNKDSLLLLADKNGNPTSDHATYGFPILCHQDFNEDIPNYIKTKQEYTDLIKDFDFSNRNILEIKNDLYNYYLVKNLGYYNLVDFGNTSSDHKEFLTFMFSDNELKRQYILGGEPSGEKFLESFNFLYELYKTHKADLVDLTSFLEGNSIKKDIYTKMMASIALEYGVTIRPNYGKINGFKPDGSPTIIYSDLINPIERYEIYKYLRNNNSSTEENNKPLLANKVFDDLPVEYMRWVFDTPMFNDEIKWINYQSRKKKKFNGGFSVGGYDFLAYTTPDAHNKLIKEKRLGLPGDPVSEANFSIYDAKYELSKFGITNDGNIRYWIPWESGQVCGGISYNGVAVLNSAGFPATIIGQPGHGAYLNYFFDTKEQKYRWKIDNNVGGWAVADKAKRLPLNIRPKNAIKNIEFNVSYIILTQPILEDFENYEKVKLLDILSETITDETVIVNLRKKALSLQPNNYHSWIKYITALHSANALTKEKAIELFSEFIELFDYFPMALFDVVSLFENYKIDGVALFEINDRYIKQLHKIKNSSKPGFMYNSEVKQVAEKYLNETSAPATFSFSGNNKNKIIVNPAYQNNVLKYSFDNGDTWTETMESEVSLTNDELSKITTNGILIGFEGTCAQHLIKIKQSVIPSDIAFNPINRTFNKETTYMQWSFNGVDYHDFSSLPVYETNDKIYLKYKNHEQFLGSESHIVNYKFPPNNINNRDIKVIYAPSATSISLQEILEGTTGNYITDTPSNAPQSIVLELPRITQLNNITLFKRNDGVNSGIISNLEVETSLSGAFYEKIGTFENNNLKRPFDIEFAPQPTKFIKLNILKTNDNLESFTFSFSQIHLNERDIKNDEIIYADQSGTVEIARQNPTAPEPNCPDGYAWYKMPSGINQLVLQTVLSELDELKNLITTNSSLSAIAKFDLGKFTNLKVCELDTSLTSIVISQIELINKKIDENVTVNFVLQYKNGGVHFETPFSLTFIPYVPQPHEKTKYYDENGQTILYDILVTDPQPDLISSDYEWYPLDDNNYQLIKKDVTFEITRLSDLLSNPIILNDNETLDLTTTLPLTIEEHNDNLLNITPSKIIGLVYNQISSNVTTTICVRFTIGKIRKKIEQQITFLATNPDLGTENHFYNEDGSLNISQLKTLPMPEIEDNYTWYKVKDNNYLKLKKETASEIETINSNLKSVVELYVFEKYTINSKLNLSIIERHNHKLTISDNSVSLINHRSESLVEASIYVGYKVNKFNLISKTITLKFNPVVQNDQSKNIYYNSFGDRVTFYIDKSQEQPVAGKGYTWYKINDNKYQLLKNETNDNLINLKKLLADKIVVEKNKKEFVISDLMSEATITLKDNNGLKVQGNKIVLVDAKNKKEAKAKLVITFKKGQIEETITQEISFVGSSVVSKFGEIGIIIGIVLTIVLIGIGVTVGVVLAVMKKKKNKTTKSVNQK